MLRLSIVKPQDRIAPDARRKLDVPVRVRPDKRIGIRERLPDDSSLGNAKLARRQADRLWLLRRLGFRGSSPSQPSQHGSLLDRHRLTATFVVPLPLLMENHAAGLHGG